MTDVEDSKANRDRPTSKMYQFFRTPDGENCMEKLAWMTGYGAATGTFVSAIDILGVTKPSTPLAAFARYLTFVGPAAAMGTVYATTVCVSASMRGKNDQFNHFFGGLAMGAVLGTRCRSQKVVWGSGFALGCVCMIIKRAYMDREHLTNDPGRIVRGKFHHYDQGFFGATKPHEMGNRHI